MSSDSELFELIQRGDNVAFETLFKTHYSHLCAYANKFVSDKDTAEEIVQEFFFQFWQKRNETTIKTSLQSYIFRAVHNSCINHIKQNVLHKKHQENILSENKDEVYEETEIKEESNLKDKIREAIDKLPPERRKIFIMNRYNDLTYKQIASDLGLSIKTVENQMGKALKFLRDELKDLMPVLIYMFLFISENIFKN